jgi:heme/copper-type cytochrome/quinol oxidase subunit 4
MVNTTQVLLAVAALFSPALGIAGTAWLEKFRRVPYLLPCAGTAVLGLASSLIVCEQATTYFAERLVVGLACTCYALSLYWLCLWLYKNEDKADDTRLGSIIIAVILAICIAICLIWWGVVSTPDALKALWWSPALLGWMTGSVFGIRRISN